MSNRLSYLISTRETSTPEHGHDVIQYQSSSERSKPTQLELAFELARPVRRSSPLLLDKGAAATYPV